MKILIDLTSLADNFSGIERYAACLSREMIRCDNDKYVLLFKNEVHQLFFKYIGYDNIQMVIIPGCNKLFFNQIRLPFEIYKHKADVYLFMAFPVPVLLFKKNMVSTIHDICCWDCPETMNGLSNWYFKISHRIALIKCKRIITISEFSKNRIVNKLKYPRAKIWLIYCGVDENFLYREETIYGSKEVINKYHLPEKYLLSLSTLEPRKNIKLLVDAYRKLVLEHGFDVPLVLAGRKGWKMDELLNNVEETVKNKILFTGFVDELDLPYIYGNASIFVFPSMYEGFGMPPLEAMACGTSVISSDSTSLPEVLGEAADYFVNNNVNSLISAIMGTRKSEIDNKILYRQAKKFSWKKEAQKLRNCIMDLQEI